MVIFYKVATLLDGTNGVGEGHYRHQLLIGQPSGIERALLDVGLDLETPRLIGASFGTGILESTPAFGVYYIAIAPSVI